jgi:hypothetical protein
MRTDYFPDALVEGAEDLLVEQGEPLPQVVQKEQDVKRSHHLAVERSEQLAAWLERQLYSLE